MHLREQEQKPQHGGSAQVTRDEEVPPTRQGRPDTPPREGTEREYHPGRLQAAMPSGKVPGRRAAADPGAAPIGTDEEAAGTPLSGGVIEQEVERAAQRGGRRGLSAQDAMSEHHDAVVRRQRPLRILIWSAAAMILALALLLWFV